MLALATAFRAFFLLAGLMAVLWMLETRFALSLHVAIAAFLALLFLVLLLYQNEVNRRAKWYANLAQLNDEGVARRARDWAALRHDDLVRDDPDHPFADDLDLFGLGGVHVAPQRVQQQ